jgi:hypothetical protein
VANILDTQTIIDGDSRVVVKCVGLLDTSNLALTTIVDVSALTPACGAVRIDKVDFSVSSQLVLRLWWDATTDDEILALVDSTTMDFSCFGGLQNPRSTGWNGDIRIDTSGWASGTQLFSLVLVMTKQETAYAL